MLLTVSEFKERVRRDMEKLVVDLQEATGRLGADEADAWRSSLPAVADLFSVKALEPFHVFFGGSGHTAVEYQLPATSAWCDLILLGSRQRRPSALVMELKHWDLNGHRPGPAEGLMVCGVETRLHPSKQVGNYTNYIRRFHSEVLDRDALVSGCVFFSRSGLADAYAAQPNHVLATTFPVFTTSTSDVERRFPEYATSLLTEPDEAFAKSFEAGRYKQDRGFVRQIGQQILDPTSSPFVLLDKQDQAFLECRERVRRVVDARDASSRKHVVIVHGPPGSGKSVIAAKLWASLTTDGTTREGNIVITTTSSSQNSNWVHLVDKAARLAGAGGIVKKTTSYHPAALPTIASLQRRFGAELFSDPMAWRGNVALLRKLQPAFRPGAEDDAYLVSIVDEAHALINPEHPAGRSGPLGFAVNLGPQAYHVMRASVLTVFFMDSDQGFRDRENTTVDDIIGWAKELGASVDQIDLSGLQFRCAGSKHYVDWIQIIRSNTHPQIAARHAERWRSIASETPAFFAAVGERKPRPYAPRGHMEFEIVDSPAAMEAVVRNRLSEGYSGRLLASFSRKWKTKDIEAPHTLPPAMLDFCIEYKDREGRLRTWSRPWNVTVKGDYTQFVQAAAGSAMAKDPLCEVGCPYAVRGFDFDYVGLIWSRDLVWRDDRWVVMPEHVAETGVKATRSAAKKERDSSGPNHAELLRRVWQSYRILLTRALRGVVLYVEDEPTRAYLEKASRS